MKQIVSPSNRIISNIDAARDHLQRPRISQEMTRHVDARSRHSKSRTIIGFSPFESDSVVNAVSDLSGHARDIRIQAELCGYAHASIHKQDVKSHVFDPPSWHWWAALDREQHAPAYGAGVVSATALCGSRKPDRDAFGAKDVVAGEFDGAFDDAVCGWCGAVVFHADGAALVFLA